MKPEIRNNSLGMEFVLIPSGEFLMGSPEDEADVCDDEKPQHRVIISRPFYLGRCMVTQAQWSAVMGSIPKEAGYHGRGIGDNYPLDGASWEEVQEFIRLLRERDGHPYRLPTEAEWEYACRAGTQTRWSFGDDELRLHEYAHYNYAFLPDEIRQMYEEDLRKGVRRKPGWIRDMDARYIGGVILSQSPERLPVPLPVGQKLPNPWGLYDMHGNTGEMVQDLYDRDYYQKCAEEGTVRDPQGSSVGRDYCGILKNLRVIRNNGCLSTADGVRSAIRGYSSDGGYGFRLAFTPEADE